MLEYRVGAQRVDTHGSIATCKAIDYEIAVDTDEDDRRLELLHTKVRKFDTISNTGAVATELSGRIRRRAPRAPRGE